MKNIFYILLFSTSAFSQNYHYALGEKQSASPAPPEPGPPVERNTANLFLTETFENSNLDNNPDLSDFYHWKFGWMVKR